MKSKQLKIRYLKNLLTEIKYCSMDKKILKWLFDIKLAIEDIESYFQDFPKDFNQYSKKRINSYSLHLGCPCPQ